MKRKKIIHIYYRAYGPFFPPKSSPYYYLNGWSSLIARYTLRHTNEFVIENWRPEKEVNKIIEKEIQGIKCKLFPFSRIRGNAISFAILKALRKEAKRHHILINLHCVHHLDTYIIAMLFRKYPLVIHHHGDTPPIYKESRSFYKFILHKLQTILEKRILKFVDYFSVVSKLEMGYLRRVTQDSRKVALEAARVYFDEWKPIDKEKARAMLGIPKNKKVLIYVGKYHKLKGVDIILKTYNYLRNMYDVELIMIGGAPCDPLYEAVKSAGVREYGYIPHESLPIYYSAADVYLLPSFDKKLCVNFGGITTAVIEALACNVPVVTRQLIHFPSNEWNKVGRIPRNENEVFKYVKEIFDAPQKFKDCRKVAQKYYDASKIMKNTINTYNKLFKMYYNIK